MICLTRISTLNATNLFNFFGCLQEKYQNNSSSQCFIIHSSFKGISHQKHCRNPSRHCEHSGQTRQPWSLWLLPPGPKIVSNKQSLKSIFVKKRLSYPRISILKHLGKVLHIDLLIKPVKDILGSSLGLEYKWYHYLEMTIVADNLTFFGMSIFISSPASPIIETMLLRTSTGSAFEASSWLWLAFSHFNML